MGARLRNGNEMSSDSSMRTESNEKLMRRSAYSRGPHRFRSDFALIWR